MSKSPSAAASDVPTVVLVHGAFADGSSWAGVIGELQAAGLEVVAPANALRGIETDADDLASVVGEIAGPVLLVGHSYGGAVITNAAVRTGNVIGLVFVAAYAPDEGENLAEIGARFPPTAIRAALRPSTHAQDEFLIDRAAFPAVFAADVPPKTAKVMAATQRPIAAAAFAEKTGVPAWKTLPSWAAIATADQAIGVEALHARAERAGAISVEIDASHAIAVSRPEAIADLIRTAVGSLA
jgi:pimeloyl-ACP methyl ester carboxylesterase